MLELACTESIGEARDSMAALAEVDHESKQQSRTSSPTDRGGRFKISILQGQGLFLRTTSLELTQRRFRVNSIVGTN